MRFVQLVLADQQAGMLRLAVDAMLADENYVMEDEERADYERLAVFLGQAFAHPEQFAPTGSNAVKIRKIVRAAKGESQPQGRKNRRKARQEKRQRFHKWRRRERQAIAKLYNEAREKTEAEMQEMEQLHQEFLARIDAQPKYRIVAEDGTMILDGIPAEFVIGPDGENLLPKIIVPGA